MLSLLLLVRIMLLVIPIRNSSDDAATSTIMSTARVATSPLLCSTPAATNTAAAAAFNVRAFPFLPCFSPATPAPLDGRCQCPADLLSIRTGSMAPRTPTRPPKIRQKKGATRRRLGSIHHVDVCHLGVVLRPPQKLSLHCDGRRRVIRRRNDDRSASRRFEFGRAEYGTAELNA